VVSDPEFLITSSIEPVILPNISSLLSFPPVSIVTGSQKISPSGLIAPA
jgi:hypothetical protein